MSTPICPNCRKGRPGSYRESWEGFSMQFRADASGVPEEIGVMVEGNPSGKVEATCADCGYTWRCRGTLQITDLRSP